MKTITIITLLTLTLLQAGELEKEIKYLGNDGTTETHEVVCHNGKSGIVSIDNATREMSVEGENLGKVTFKVAVEKVCGS
jgi:hypothetical protein